MRFGRGNCPLASIETGKHTSARRQAIIWKPLRRSRPSWTSRNVGDFPSADRLPADPHDRPSEPSLLVWSTTSAIPQQPPPRCRHLADGSPTTPPKTQTPDDTHHVSRTPCLARSSPFKSLVATGSARGTHFFHTHAGTHAHTQSGGLSPCVLSSADALTERSRNAFFTGPPDDKGCESGDRKGVCAPGEGAGENAWWGLRGRRGALPLAGIF